MNRYLNPEDKHGMVLSILMILIGLVLPLWPGQVMTTALTVLGLALLVGGALLSTPGTAGACGTET